MDELKLPPNSEEWEEFFNSTKSLSGGGELPIQWKKLRGMCYEHMWIELLNHAPDDLSDDCQRQCELWHLEVEKWMN